MLYRREERADVQEDTFDRERETLATFRSGSLGEGDQLPGSLSVRVFRVKALSFTQSCGRHGKAARELPKSDSCSKARPASRHTPPDPPRKSPAIWRLPKHRVRLSIHIIKHSRINLFSLHVCQKKNGQVVSRNSRAN